MDGRHRAYPKEPGGGYRSELVGGHSIAPSGGETSTSAASRILPPRSCRTQSSIQATFGMPLNSFALSLPVSLLCVKKKPSKKGFSERARYGHGVGVVGTRGPRPL